MTNKKQTIWTMILTFSLLGLIGLGMYFRHVTATSISNLNRVTNQLEAVESKHSSQTKLVNENYYTHVAESGNKYTKPIGIQNKNWTEFNEETNTFFKTYYSYDSAASYKERTIKLQQVATSSVLSDANLFSSNSKVIDTVGATSSFDSQRSFVITNSSNSNTQVTGLVSVNYEFGFKNSSLQNGTQLYRVALDTDTNKIVNVELLNN
mgnify:CR=1 FL=1